MTARLAFLLSLLLTGCAALWVLSDPEASATTVAPAALTLHGLWCWWAAVWLAQGPTRHNLIYGCLALVTAPLPLYAVLCLMGSLSWPVIGLISTAAALACGSASGLTLLALRACESAAARRLVTVVLQVAPPLALAAGSGWLTG